MGISNWIVDKIGETAAEFQGSDGPLGFENVKNIIADKLQSVADALGEKAADQDAQSGIDQYGKQASERFEQANGRVREYVGQSPGRSLLIAGAVGLIIGAIWGRR